MYNFKDIKSIHFEISSLCQASCPMCARNQHGGLDNPLIKEANLNFETYKKILTVEFIQQLETISMCGNFGDPVINNDIIDMIEYTVSINPDIYIDIHTNGSMRTKEWWAHLAQIMPRNHMVNFALDGLEDTHHLYRIGTSFNKIIENAKSYIAAGGKARWVFITFKHNEHQLELCRKMAEELGFESFSEKQTSRFIGGPKFDVYDKQGNVVYKLEQPTDQKVIFIDKKTVDNYREVFKTATVSCEVEKSKSIYIDALGYLWPCCFTGGVLYQYSTPSQVVSNFHIDNKQTMNKFLENFGGVEGLNLRKHSIEDIVDSDAWQTQWNRAFETNSLVQCTRTCGKFPQPVISQSKDQFLTINKFD